MSTQYQAFENILYFQLQSVDDAKRCLELLSKLNYNERILSITPKSVGSLLHCLTSSIPLNKCSDLNLLNNFFKITTVLTTSQSITLHLHCLNTILTHLEEIWKFCCEDSQLMQNMMESLSAILYQNGSNILNEHLLWLLKDDGLIITVLSHEKATDECKKFTVQCVSGICLVTESGEHVGEELLVECCQILVKSMLQKKNGETTAGDCRFKFATLKGLYNICSIVEDIKSLQTGPLLAVLKRCMLYGLSDQTTHLSDELEPTPIPDIFPRAAAAPDGEAKEGETPSKQVVGKGKARRAKRKLKAKKQSDNTPIMDADGFLATNKSINPMQQMQRAPWTKFTSSESEYSDTEGSEHAKLRSLLSKIRQMSLNVLYIIVLKMDRRTLLGYWGSFLNDANSPHEPPSLFTIIRKDTVPQARASALSVLSAMLDGSKNFLILIADESRSTTTASSFVPFSVALATMIRVIHNQLMAAARSEQSGVALVQLLRSLSVLVLNTPYKKLRPGLLVQIATQVRYYLKRTHNTNVQLSCLMLLATIATNSAPLAEVANIITDESATQPTLSNKSSPSVSGDRTPVDEIRDIKLNETFITPGTSWLLDDCIVFATSNVATHAPLVQEALLTMATIVKGYFPVVKSYVGVLSDVACGLMSSSTLSSSLLSPLRLHSARLIQELGGSIAQYLKTHNDPDLEEQSVIMWTKVLSGPLQSTIQAEDDSPLQGSACDCLSNIGSNTFQRLPKSKQIMCVTMLLGLTSDESGPVKSRAIRAIGMFAMYTCLQEDISFLEDVSEVVLRAMDDPAIGIRFNGAWSLANLTDSIVVVGERSPSFHESFPDSIILRLLTKAIGALNDKDKVRFNMMRTVGNLLRYMTGAHAADVKFKTKILEAITAVSQMTSGNSVVKVRWNACTACCNFLRNDRLPLGHPEWTDQVYKALCSSLTNCKNFKVQIKAALALSTPTKREQFGSCEIFKQIINCLVTALEESDSTADFTEYKFKETLQDQLCTTLIYLILLAEEKDLINIGKCLESKEEKVESCLKNYTHALKSKMGSNYEKKIEADENDVYTYTKTLSNEEKLTRVSNSYEKMKSLNNSLNETGKIVPVSKNILKIYQFIVT